MEREGLLVTRRGQGTFVTEKPVEVQEIRNRLAELAARKYLGEMTDLGFSGEQAVDFLTDPLHAGAGEPPQNEGDR